MKRMLRVIKWMVLPLLAAGLIICIPPVWEGWQLYQSALAHESLSDRVERVRQQPGYTRLDELPAIYTNAVIAVEDQRFYRHCGFDPLATARALLHDLQAGSFVEGGSTITQQLAKNLFLSQEKEIPRKIAEVLLAFDLERAYTKDEILELYVNSIYYGNGYYCVGDACRGYFGKEPSAMTDAECTLLAGIPNAPSSYAPTVSTRLARERQHQVLARMVEAGFLSKEQAAQIAGRQPSEAFAWEPVVFYVE